MNISELANIAEIVSGFGVIASLIFVALEIRKGTAQSKMANWASLVDRYHAQSMVHGKEDALAVFRKQIRFHLGFKGSREWFEDFESQRAFPAPLMQAIHQALDE